MSSVPICLGDYHRFDERVQQLIVYPLVDQGTDPGDSISYRQSPN